MPECRAKPAFSIVLHDVSPASWPTYQDFIRAVDAKGRIPLTLLVVPDFHHLYSLDRFPGFRRAIDQRIALGDEVVLHGYYHQDDSALRPDPVNLFMRRIYTHEGEFYSLDELQATQRLQSGLALFKAYDWPVAGFVAPAWLMSPGARAALRRSSLRYTSDLKGLIRLPDWQRLTDTPTLVWSARSAWRRVASRYWNQLRLAQCLSGPYIRLGLHPNDMAHQAAVHFWLNTLETLLPTHTPLTKAQWVYSCS